MPFIARYGFLLLVLVFCGCFHLSIALLVVAFCWYEKPKRATKGKKCPNGNQAFTSDSQDPELFDDPVDFIDVTAKTNLSPQQPRGPKFKLCLKFKICHWVTLLKMMVIT